MKISVITVCYNSVKTIEDTILSILAQDHPDVEHLILDGGSTDGTLDIIHRYLPRLGYFHSKKDKGIYDAMNQGIRLARGDVIGFLNADDVYQDKTVLSQVAAAFEGKEVVEGVYADLVYVKPDNLNAVVRYWKSCPFKFGAFAQGWSPAHPTLYLRRLVYERLGGFDLTFPIGTDIELMMRFLEKEKVQTRYIPSIWVKMRVGGVSNKSVQNILKQNQQILKAFRKNHIKVNPVLFWIVKICSRLKQFIRRPDREHAH